MGESYYGKTNHQIRRRSGEGSSRRHRQDERHYPGGSSSQNWKVSPELLQHAHREKPIQQDSDKTITEKFVGGLYGVTIGNAFFGESMCSLVPNASKLALIHLAKTMQQTGGRIIDCQFETPHLKSMGGRYIPYDEYMKIIRSET